MTPRRKPLGILVVMIVAGLLIGSALSEVLRAVLPAGVPRTFLTEGVAINLGPATLNLGVLWFTLGIGLRISILSVGAIVLAAYLFRWY
jgi:hypothetical protein